MSDFVGAIWFWRFCDPFEAKFDINTYIYEIHMYIYMLQTYRQYRYGIGFRRMIMTMGVMCE